MEDETTDPYTGCPTVGKIPPEMRSEYEEGPFQTCLVCRGTLDDGRTYQILKVRRGRECVLEMALCFRCANEVQKEFSEESREAIRRFRMRAFQCSAENTCEFCPRPLEELTAFTVTGLCRGASLIHELVFVCDTCEEALNELLSQKTRDVEGDFIRQNFPTVPEALDLSPSFCSI